MPRGRARSPTPGLGKAPRRGPARQTSGSRLSSASPRPASRAHGSRPGRSAAPAAPAASLGEWPPGRPRGAGLEQGRRVGRSVSPGRVAEAREAAAPGQGRGSPEAADVSAQLRPRGARGSRARLLPPGPLPRITPSRRPSPASQSRGRAARCCPGARPQPRGAHGPGRRRAPHRSRDGFLRGGWSARWREGVNAIPAPQGRRWRAQVTLPSLHCPSPRGSDRPDPWPAGVGISRPCPPAGASFPLQGTRLRRPHPAK